MEERVAGRREVVSLLAEAREGDVVVLGCEVVDFLPGAKGARGEDVAVGRSGSLLSAAGRRRAAGEVVEAVANAGQLGIILLALLDERRVSVEDCCRSWTPRRRRARASAADDKGADVLAVLRNAERDALSERRRFRQTAK